MTDTMTVETVTAGKRLLDRMDEVEQHAETLAGWLEAMRLHQASTVDYAASAAARMAEFYGLHRETASQRGVAECDWYHRVVSSPLGSLLWDLRRQERNLRRIKDEDCQLLTDQIGALAEAVAEEMGEGDGE